MWNVCASYLQSALNFFSSIKNHFMLPDKILQSDLLDIIFENRNKTYGAYALRRSYNKTIAVALSITLFIAAVFSLIELLYHPKGHDFVTSVVIDPYVEFT